MKIEPAQDWFLGKILKLALGIPETINNIKGIIKNDNFDIFRSFFTVTEPFQVGLQFNNVSPFQSTFDFEMMKIEYHDESSQCKCIITPDYRINQLIRLFSNDVPN